MEKLADAFSFGISGDGIHLCESNTCKTGSRRQVTRKSEGTHSAAVGSKRQIICKSIRWLFRRKVHIIIQLEHLLWKRRIICEHTDRIVVDMQTVCSGFYCNRCSFIRDDPVKLRQRKLFAEWSIDQIHVGKKCANFRDRSTLA